MCDKQIFLAMIFSLVLPACGDSDPSSAVNVPAAKGKWQVEEGEEGRDNYEWSGHWEVGSQGDFKGMEWLNQDGEPVLSSGMIKVTADNTVSVRKTKSTDGKKCTYTGTLSGKSVEGTYYCNDSSRPLKWRAKLPD